MIHKHPKIEPEEGLTLLDQGAQEAEEQQPSLGHRLRTFRLRRGQSLRETAKAARVTASFLSDVERDQVLPSITTLRRLCEALEIRVIDALEEGAHAPRSVVRAGARRRILSPGGDVDFEMLVEAPGRPFDMLYVRLRPGAATAEEDRSHHAKECLFVIQGRASMSLGGLSETLDAGDSIYYSSEIPHRTVNVGDDDLVFVIIIAGAF